MSRVHSCSGRELTERPFVQVLKLLCHRWDPELIDEVNNLEDGPRVMEQAMFLDEVSHKHKVVVMFNGCGLLLAKLAKMWFDWEHSSCLLCDHCWNVRTKHTSVSLDCYHLPYYE